MQPQGTFDWKVGSGIALGILAVVRTFSRPLASEGGAVIWLVVLVGLPCWVLLKTKSNPLKLAMIVIIAFAAVITIAPSSPSGGSGCHIEYDGRNNPEVC